MFSNRLRVGSNLIDSNILKESFVIYPKNIPKYFPNIPKKIDISFRRKSLRSCSGFINYFRNMVCFLSPCDFEIIYDQNGVKESHFGRGILNDGKRLSIHSNDQFLKYVNQDKYYAIVKLMFDIRINCSSPIIINNPWWNFSDFETVPGIINASKDYQELNLFLPLPKDKNHIFVKKGTPLCYMLFETDKKIKLKFVKKWKDFQWVDYYFSTIGKYLNKRRIKSV